LYPVRYSYATHLECSLTGQRHDIARLQGLSQAGKPLLVRYDLAALGRELSRSAIEARPSGLWRWQELLPVPAPDYAVSLGEIETPLGRKILGGEVRDGAHTPDAVDWLVARLPGPHDYQSAYREGLDTDGLDQEGVYVGTSNGQVYASPDGGDHWQRLPGTLPPVVSVTCMVS